MKYLKQFSIILAISLAGEILNYLIPLRIPASIYGIVILFTLLSTHVISVDDVKEVGKFLIEIITVMFIPAVVKLMDFWDHLYGSIIAYSVIVVVSTVFVMVVSGWVTQLVVRKGNRR